MDFGQRLYTIRKQHGLSQEQLAERLGVSRQAVSKWESGRAVPETEKLIAISDHFGVSLDFLVKGEEPKSAAEPPEILPQQRTSDKRYGVKAGAALVAGGISAAVIWGVLSALQPSAAAAVENSSAVTINGSGIFLLLAAAAVAAGVVLILRKK